MYVDKEVCDRYAVRSNTYYRCGWLKTSARHLTSCECTRRAHRRALSALRSYLVFEDAPNVSHGYVPHSAIQGAPCTTTRRSPMIDTCDAVGEGRLHWQIGPAMHWLMGGCTGCCVLGDDYGGAETWWCANMSGTLRFGDIVDGFMSDRREHVAEKLRMTAVLDTSYAVAQP